MSNNLNRLTQLSKQQEMELYSDLIAKCPAGYVRDILADMKADVERAIASDFGFIPFGVYMAQVVEQQAELKKTAIQLSDLKSQVRDMEQRKQFAEAELYKLRRIVSGLAGQ